MSYDAIVQHLRCPFCSSDRLEESSERKAIAPQGCVPFRVDEALAAQTLRKWLGSSFWRPGNLAKTELRRRKRWHWVRIGPSPDEEERTAFYEPVDKDRLPGEMTDSSTVRSSVVDAIEQLPQEFREAVKLRDLAGLSYDEIAKIIDCPVGTVKSRVNRGRLRLQRQLRPLAEEVIGGLAPAVSPN